MLDTQCLGKLSPVNCGFEVIRSEFVMILGSMLSKIKYKGRTYNRDQFIEEGSQTIAGLCSQ